MSDLESYIPTGAALRFVHRPTAVPGDLRISWRLAVVALMLQWSRGQKASLSKLHILNSGLRSSHTLELLRSLLSTNHRPLVFQFAVEPALGRALDFCRAEGLVTPEGPTVFKLTEKGKKAAVAIEDMPDTLVSEREILSWMSPRLTEGMVKDLLRVPR